jgi:predicted enzyme related to lactoylglutathione lyase
MDMAPNPVVHLELHTGDRTRACDFYAGVLGWRREEIHAGGSSYWALAMGGRGVDGGVVECDTAQPLWLPYVQVADVAASTDRAVELGAAVLLERREGPAGWRSVVTTPQGGDVAFWQPKR